MKIEEEEFYKEFCCGKKIEIIKTGGCCYDVLEEAFRSHEEAIVVCKHEDTLLSVYCDVVRKGKGGVALYGGVYGDARMNRWDVQYYNDLSLLKSSQKQIVALPSRYMQRDFVKKMQNVADVIYIDFSRCPLDVNLFPVGLCKKKCTFFLSNMMDAHWDEKIRAVLRV